MNFYWLALGILSTWRVTHFFQAEDGPWDVVVKLRVAVGNGFFGRLLDCFYCLSLWVSLPVAWVLGETIRETILLWLSFSAGAILLEKFSSAETTVSPAVFIEEPIKEKDHGLLRSEEKSSHSAGDFVPPQH